MLDTYNYWQQWVQWMNKLGELSQVLCNVAGSLLQMEKPSCSFSDCPLEVTKQYDLNLNWKLLSFSYFLSSHKQWKQILSIITVLGIIDTCTECTADWRPELIALVITVIQQVHLKHWNSSIGKEDKCCENGILKHYCPSLTPTT